MMQPITATADFSKELRHWDGFGVCYIETAQTPDYAIFPQDIGGLSSLSEQNRLAMLDLIFGYEGLRPGLVKLMLDPFHQSQSEAENETQFPPIQAYEHAASTRWSRFFARRGQQMARWMGGRLQLLLGLYGPPAWMTEQGVLRGRDLKPGYLGALARYIISYARYLRDMEGLSVRYLSLHHQGEESARWQADGKPVSNAQDYAFYCPPNQLVELLCMMRPMLDQAGLRDLGIATGEVSNWFRFSEWGYADAILDHPQALDSTALVTAQGFITLANNRWFSDWRSSGIDALRARKPSLPAWVSSVGWYNGDVDFLNIIRGHIYAAKVNGFIPWTISLRPTQWLKNRNLSSGTAFFVDEQGDFRIEPAYYYYKQVTRAGQPGMAVCRVSCTDSQISLMAFGARGTANSNSVVLLNLTEEEKTVHIKLQGSVAREVEGFRTSPTENYESLGFLPVENNAFVYAAPPRSATTFFGQ